MNTILYQKPPGKEVQLVRCETPEAFLAILQKTECSIGTLGKRCFTYRESTFSFNEIVAQFFQLYDNSQAPIFSDLKRRILTLNRSSNALLNRLTDSVKRMTSFRKYFSRDDLNRLKALALKPLYSEREAAARKIQAHYRGFHTRLKVLTPKTLEFVGCHEKVNAILQKGKSIKTTLGDNLILDYDHDRYRFSFYKKGGWLGKGSFKRVWKGTEYHFDLRWRTVRSKSCALCEIKDDNFPNELSVHTALYKACPEGIYLSKPYKPLFKNIYRQKLYSDDFDDTFVYSQKFKALKDVVRAVEWLHQVGLSHNDLKEDNIFVDEGKGVLHDFGKYSQFGSYFKPDEKDYYAWDPCFQYGSVTTPYQDWYAVAVVLVLLIFKFSPYQVKKFRDEIMVDIRNGSLKECSLYFGNSFLDLSSLGQKPFLLLYQIIVESSLVRLELKKVEGYPRAVKEHHIFAAMEKVRKGRDYICDPKTIKQEIDQIEAAL